MAMLGRKKNTKAQKEKVATEAPAVVSASVKSSAHTLVKPRITEKATVQSERNVYVFEIQGRAGKKDVAQAIFNSYKVTPVKIGIVRSPAKRVFVRGKAGLKSGVKKAYVYLKEGDKIELV